MLGKHLYTYMCSAHSPGAATSGYKGRKRGSDRLLSGWTPESEFRPEPLTPGPLALSLWLIHLNL